MKTLHFSILIRAPRRQVWSAMLHTPTYEQWTAAFCEGSRYEGSWEPGSRIHFLTPSDEGMYSDVVENRPGEFVSIRHLGEIKEGQEVPNPEGSGWALAMENYTYTDADGGTLVQVDVDTIEAYEQFMQEAFPRALDQLRQICETAPAGA